MLQVVGGSPDLVYPHIGIHLPFKPILIPAGTRVTARTASISGIAAAAIYLTGYESHDYPRVFYPDMPDLYAKGLIGYRSRVYPDAATTVATSGAAWTMGAWAPLINPTPAPTLIRGLCSTLHLSQTVGGVQSQFEISVWNGAAEIIVGRVGVPRNGLGPAGGWGLLPKPYMVKAGERVSVRVADSSAGAVNWGTCLLVEEML